MSQFQFQKTPSQRASNIADPADAEKAQNVDRAAVIIYTPDAIPHSSHFTLTCFFFVNSQGNREMNTQLPLATRTVLASRQSPVFNVGPVPLVGVLTMGPIHYSQLVNYGARPRLFV